MINPTHPVRRTLDDHVMHSIKDWKRPLRVMPTALTGATESLFYIGPTHSISFKSVRYRIRKKLLACIKVFFVISILLSLLLFSRGGDTEQSPSFIGGTPAQWFKFILVVMFVELLTIIADHLFFYWFECVWRGSYSIVYYMHSLHGPLGHLLSVVVVMNFFHNMHVPRSMPNWRTIVTTVVAVLMLYILKSYWQRRHFVGLMQLRFRDKLHSIDTCQRIFSLLSQPLATPPSEYPLPELSPGFVKSESLATISSAHSLPPTRDSPFLPRWARLLLCRDSSQSEGRRGSDPESLLSDDEDGSCEGDGEGAGKGRREEQDEKFWEKVNFVRSGSLVVDIGGEGKTVRLQSKQDAVSFGKSLFEHLRKKFVHTHLHYPHCRPSVKGSSRVSAEAAQTPHSLPTWFITSLLRESFGATGGVARRGEQLPERENGFSDMLSLCLQAGLMFNYTVNHSDRPDSAEASDPTAARCFFRTQDIPQQHQQQQQSRGQQTVGESQMVQAVAGAYKDLRYASASLANLQDLHRSVTDIADTVFWLGVFLLLHMIFGLKTFAALTPLLTIVFGLSFALGPSVGSLCLSVVFVMFMLPYDVGNRVRIERNGGGKDDFIVGNVAAITLGYTTIMTTYNEKLRIPNHQLFHRSIVNMHESPNAIFELEIELPLFPSERPPRDDGAPAALGVGAEGKGGDLHSEFWSRVEVCLRRDRVDEWLDMAVHCRQVLSAHNSVRYCVWLTHRAGWHEGKRIYRSRSEAMAIMRRVQQELELVPVSVLHTIAVVA